MTDTAKRQAVQQQVSALLDQYESLEGRARSQTHRASLAGSIAEVLVQHRKATRVRQSKLALESPVPAMHPPEWPRTRVSARGWNGACRRCSGRAEKGHIVAWDPASGRPSKWQHVNCSDPYKDKR